MGRIKILPPRVVKLIAAGEVITSPASVVKELIENSLDAGSRFVEIQLWEGGKRKIRVRDDGWGMDREDAKLAFHRYATSKLEDDLSSIKSYGFRGEALPSIASISQVTLITHYQGVGTRVRVVGGEVREVEEIGAPKGTLVEVENLFFNLPVRRRNLKTASQELNRITEVVVKESLPHLGIHFQLENDGQEVLTLPPRGDLLSRIIDIWGEEMESLLLPLRYEEDKLRIEGLISRPGEGRKFPLCYLYFNSRPARNSILARAFQESYSTYVGKGSFPLGFIFFSLPSQEVDVNIHPGKEEVRVLKVKEVGEKLRKAVEETLSQVKPRIFMEEKKERVSPTEEALPLPIAGKTRERSKEYKLSPPFLQMRKIFLVREEEEGLLIIDQHALHERLIYEKLKEEISGKKVSSQTLIFPLTVEFSPWDKRFLEENLSLLKEIGFDIEPFGKNTFIIRSVPSLLKKVDAVSLLTDLLQEWKKIPPGKSWGEKVEEALKIIACHSAVRMGDTLQEKEILALLKEWRERKGVVTCPHGRPVFIHISWKEIERRFDRR